MSLFCGPLGANERVFVLHPSCWAEWLRGGGEGGRCVAGRICWLGGKGSGDWGCGDARLDVEKHATRPLRS
jgi:hypothetical protein